MSRKPFALILLSIMIPLLMLTHAADDAFSAASIVYSVASTVYMYHLFVLRPPFLSHPATVWAIWVLMVCLYYPVYFFCFSDRWLDTMCYNNTTALITKAMLYGALSSTGFIFGYSMFRKTGRNTGVPTPKVDDATFKISHVAFVFVFMCVSLVGQFLLIGHVISGGGLNLENKQTAMYGSGMYLVATSCSVVACSYLGWKAMGAARNLNRPALILGFVFVVLGSIAGLITMSRLVVLSHLCAFGWHATFRWRMTRIRWIIPFILPAMIVLTHISGLARESLMGGNASLNYDFEFAEHYAQLRHLAFIIDREQSGQETVVWGRGLVGGMLGCVPRTVWSHKCPDTHLIFNNMVNNEPLDNSLFPGVITPGHLAAFYIDGGLVGLFGISWCYAWLCSRIWEAVEGKYEQPFFAVFSTIFVWIIGYYPLVCGLGTFHIAAYLPALVITFLLCRWKFLD